MLSSFPKPDTPFITNKVERNGRKTDYKDKHLSMSRTRINAFHFKNTIVTPESKSQLIACPIKPDGDP